MRFKNKVGDVTGGPSGIGKEVAKRFVAEGRQIVIDGRDAAKAGAAAREIDHSGRRAIAHAGDIGVPSTADALVKAAIRHGSSGRQQSATARRLENTIL